VVAISPAAVNFFTSEQGNTDRSVAIVAKAAATAANVEQSREVTP
jgi:hypothetical protein